MSKGNWVDTQTFIIPARLKVNRLGELLAILGQDDQPVVNIATFNAQGDLVANIIPRTNTLANLQTLVSGQGEIASATDVPALVLLHGAEGEGTTHVFTPMAPGHWDDSIKTLSGVTNGVYQAPDGSPSAEVMTDFNIGAASQTALGGNASHVVVIGGTAENPTASGGNAQVIPGAGPAGNGSAQLCDTMYGKGVEVTDDGTNTKIGFFAAAPVAKPVVTGSRGGNAALTSMLTALANLGLITNSTTA